MDQKAAEENVGLAWDTYRCQCGGTAVMGVMSLIAHCDKCVRVFAFASLNGKGLWFEDKEAANAEYAKTLNAYQQRQNLAKGR